MKRGFNQGLHPTLIPSQYDVIYNVGMKGTKIDPSFIDKWKNLEGWKRGVIHQPILSVENNVLDNASAFLGLLNDLHYGDWNNGWPIIIDIWEAPSANRFDLDNIRQYGIYVAEYFQPKLKPLLRVILSTWQSWMSSNSIEATRLLQNYDILLCQPSVTKPSELAGVGVPAWWEFEFGKYANDPTMQYEGVVKPIPPVVPPVTPEPPVVPEPPTVTIPKKWKISLFNGAITGTIEADEE